MAVMNLNHELIRIGLTVFQKSMPLKSWTLVWAPGEP